MKISSSNHPPKTIIEIYDILYGLYGPQGWWPGHGRFEIIVGAILTQNTAWSNVEKAIKRLKSEGLLSHSAKLHALNQKKLAELIRPAGYYNIKSKRLKNFTKFLKKRYGGSLGSMSRRPTSSLRAELLEINGIGEETCDSILLYAFGRPVFVIDAYTKRIFSRHGLCGGDAAYGHLQAIFERDLPSEVRILNEFHALIVKVAKNFCRTKPKCEDCPLKGVKIVAKNFRG